MSRKEALSLEEFATAPRKAPAVPAGEPSPRAAGGIDDGGADETKGGYDQALEARKALRRTKRARVKGETCFVNVHLDRPTKRRLKLASFNTDTSMQVIMENAIVKYLDELGL
ncbi:hypothetical protein [Mesorhizobium sp. B1-1-8]|uniref:hypothetical protein n=1 Tax=Mesorhizobium sp. B1-1-8 TaxID=2589976 RepID=UPI00112AC47E|nr:hypothetical protein [Mesorhizobium sp. B1-1-8]UCI10686.1 hypothetical protein FJ974_28360 [Mesorhizobium sp. B1-1-8]